MDDTKNEKVWIYQHIIELSTRWDMKLFGQKLEISSEGLYLSIHYLFFEF